MYGSQLSIWSANMNSKRQSTDINAMFLTFFMDIKTRLIPSEKMTINRDKSLLEESVSFIFDEWQSHNR